MINGILCKIKYAYYLKGPQSQKYHYLKFLFISVLKIFSSSYERLVCCISHAISGSGKLRDLKSGAFWKITERN